MASTYTVNLGIEKIGTGEQSGTWGTTTNTNFDLIDQAINGAVTVTLASAGTSGSPNTLAITDGTVSDGRNKFIDFADGGDLGAAAYIQLTPNDAEKLVHIRNSLSGGRSIFVFQGTYNASNDFEIPNGKDVVLKFDGGGATATVTQVFEDLLVTAVAATTVDTTNIEVTNLKAKDGTSAGSIADSTGVVTLASSVLTTTDINGGSVDGVTLGTNSAVTEAQIDNININGNTISSTDTNGNVTITPDGTGSVAITKIDVAGGEIDGTAIGANSASTAVFTNLTASGTVSFSGATVSNGGTVTTVNIDGGNIDNTIIGAATPAAGSFTTVGTSSNVTIGGTLGVTGVTTMTGNLGLGITPSAWFAYNAQQIQYLGLYGSNGNGGVSYNAFFETPGAWKYIANGAATNYDQFGGAHRWFYASTGTAGGAITWNQQFQLGLTEAIVNEESNDYDFRVESDSNANMLFVDASTNRVGIGKAPLKNVLDISNSINIDGDVSPDGNGLALGDYGTTGSYKWIQSFDSHALRLNPLGNEVSIGISGLGANFKTYGNTVLNEDGGDNDFRVESDTNTHALFVDAGNSRVHIASSGTGPSNFNVQGNMAITNTSGAQFLLMGNQDSAGVNNPNIIVSGNGALEFGNGDSWSNSTGGTFSQRFSISANGVIANENSYDQDFRVESDSNTHALFVDAGGNNLEIGGNPAFDGGTAVSAIKFEALGTTTQAMLNANSANANFYVSKVAGYTNSNYFSFYVNTAGVGSIATTGTATTYNTSSDARLKENIADAEDASSLVDAIKVRQFDWKADGSHQRYGMVAQELIEVAPEAVTGEPDGEEMMGVDYSKLVPMLIKEIQSLRARVAQLEGA